MSDVLILGAEAIALVALLLGGLFVAGGIGGAR